jgi:hypothetical protein
MRSNKEKRGEMKKPYQKPSWQKQEMFEKFSLACNRKPGSCAGQKGS